jgi:1,4-dihydroxy-2-naphthoyl-CoA synthase
MTREGMAVVDWQRSGPAPGQEYTDGFCSDGGQKIPGDDGYLDARLLYYMSEEAQEGRDAFREKRRPGFARFPRRP